MFKLNVKVKEYQLIVKARVPHRYMDSTRQYEAFLKESTCGFLKLSVMKRNQVEFIGPISISLYERLNKPISKHDFFFIVEQIVLVTQKLMRAGLSYNNLVLDLHYIFFNETTKEINFICLPVASSRDNIDMISFIESIIYSSTPHIQQDGDYLSNFIYFIKNLDEYNAEEIESYIAQLDESIISIIKNKNSKIESLDSFDSEETVLFDDEKTELFEDEETVLFSEENKSYFHNTYQNNLSYAPTLVRTLTNEIIRIDKPVFRIGKEEDCVDYIVTNNIAISRSHADIICRSGKYFVFDLRSKNKSYINNRVLPAEQEVEIMNGDVLKLADEEFLFQV